MASLTYRTYALVGVLQSGGCGVVRTWEHVPLQGEVDAAKTVAPKLYIEFVLMTPVGESTPGNYEAPPPDDSMYCG